MPFVNVKENIRQIHDKMKELHEELLRLEGVLRTFNGFDKAGLTNIDLPQSPNEELESTQEKPE
jgi:hypothetical protein